MESNKGINVQTMQAKQQSRYNKGGKGKARMNTNSSVFDIANTMTSKSAMNTVPQSDTNIPAMQDVNKPVVQDVNKPVIQVIKTKNSDFMDDMERLALARETGTHFKVKISSYIKKIVRDDCGIKTDHDKNRSDVSYEQKPNNVILRNIASQNRKSPKTAISFLVFSSFAATKIDNVELVKSIVNMLKEYMTIDEILEAKYGDDEYNLINTAAWNLSIGVLRFCVSSGANIKLRNKAGETIYDMLDGGKDHAFKYNNKKNARSGIIEANYRKCTDYIRESERNASMFARVEDESKGFSYKKKTPEKESVTKNETKDETKAVAKAVAKAETQVDEYSFTVAKKSSKKKQPVKTQAPVLKKTTTMFSAFGSDSEDEDESEDDEDMKKGEEKKYDMDADGREYANSKICKVYDSLSLPADELSTMVHEMQNDMSEDLVKYMMKCMADEGLEF